MEPEWKILRKYPIPESLQESLTAIFGDSTNPYVLLGCMGDSVISEEMHELSISDSEAVLSAIHDYEYTILEYLERIANKFRTDHSDVIDRPDELLTRARTYLISLREHYRAFSMFREDSS